MSDSSAIVALFRRLQKAVSALSVVYASVLGGAGAFFFVFSTLRQERQEEWGAVLFLLVFGVAATCAWRILYDKIIYSCDGLRQEINRLEAGGVVNAERDQDSQSIDAVRQDCVRLRRFAQMASDIHWETNADGKFTYVSDGGSVLPESSEIVVGGDLLTLEKHVGDETKKKAFREKIQNKAAFSGVQLFFLRGSDEKKDAEDSVLFVINLNGCPLWDDQGRFLGYYGVGVDSTDMIEIVGEARERMAAVHDAIDSISEGFVLFNAEGRLLLCNDNYRKAYPDLADCLTPGQTFESILRAAVDRGKGREPIADMAAWVDERWRRHMDHDEPVDQALSNGRWYRISEHGTPSGGVVKILTDITEIKIREEELAGQTTRLKATLDSISQGICMFNSAGMLASWNDTFLKIMDLPTDVGDLGLNLSDFKDYEAQRSSALTEIFEVSEDRDSGGDALGMFLIGDYKLPDGRVLEVRRSAMLDGGMVATFTDITERSHFELVLKDLAQAVSRSAGNEFFRSLVVALSRALGLEIALIGELHGDSIRSIVLAVDGEVNDNIVYDLDGSPCAEVFHCGMIVIPSRIRENYANNRFFAQYDVESYIGAPLFNNALKPIGVIAVMSRRSLSGTREAQNLLSIFAARAAAELERLYTETALRDSEYRYRQLVELVPYGIAIWDKVTVLFANSAASALFGIPAPETLENQKLDSFLAEALLQELSEISFDLVDDFRLECEIMPRDNIQRFAEIRACQVMHQNRSALLLVFTDITERRRAEAELQRIQKMEAVGRMAGGIAHEFNNMLTAIGGFARLAERTPDDRERLSMCLKEIYKASDRAAALTSQLLDFSRSKPTNETKVISLSEMISDLKVFLRPLLTDGVSLSVDIADEGVCTIANPTTLNQAVLNLALNGRDAMPQGGSLTLRLRACEPDAAFLDQHEGMKPGRYALLSVTDTGTGIPEEVRDRIWEPFFTTKEPGKGTGLGLWLVYGAVRQAGGVVELNTELGCGTTFTLYLPAAEPVDVKISHEEDDFLDFFGSEGGSILLVDDEDSVRSFLKLTLEEGGYTVVAARGGAEAVELYDEGAGLFDLLVSDVSMPGMSGAELGKNLLEKNPELRILYLTGYATQDKLDEINLQKGQQILMKPINPDKLLEKVHELITL
ncbi:two-component system, cell cycle sensor histidine kinase and response regulator CckA [Azospirillaceae bacterium]